MQFVIAGATLAAAKVYLNDKPVPDASSQVAPNAVTLTSVLQEGRNDLLLVAENTQGASIQAAATLWAGTRTLTVYVRDASDQPLNGAVITARLADNQSVQGSSTSGNSQVTFEIYQTGRSAQR